jgi:hypothetical protein
MNEKNARKPPSTKPSAPRRPARTRRRASSPVSSTSARKIEALSGK